MQVDVLMRHTLGRPVPILQNTGHEALKKPTPPATAEPHFKLGKLPSCRRPYPTPHDARTSKCSLNDVDQGRPSHRTWQTTQISVQDGQRCSWRGCTNIPHRDFKIPGAFPACALFTAVWRGYDDMAAAPLSGRPWVCGIKVGQTLSGVLALSSWWRVAVGERVFGIPEWSAG